VTAARRRLNEELGITCTLSFGFFSRYRANLDHGMQENEFVHVYFGRQSGELRPDPAEVANVDNLPIDTIKRRMRQEPESFAYWLRHYFEHHLADIARHAGKATRAPASR